MLLTQAFSRYIIGVALNKKLVQEPKINKNPKTPQRKQPFLAGGCFFVPIISPFNDKTRPGWSGSLVGGAGGYCPRVQSVTSYPSTSIVPFEFLPYGSTWNGTKTWTARIPVMLWLHKLEYLI